MPTQARNTLIYGDNLAILREHIADESIDLRRQKAKRKKTDTQSELDL